MTIRTAKLATILMIGAALAATPVLAQAVTTGNQGPAEIPANRDAPFSLPGSLNPMPTPKVDAATTRDIFAMDPAPRPKPPTRCVRRSRPRPRAIPATEISGAPAPAEQGPGPAPASV